MRTRPEWLTPTLEERLRIVYALPDPAAMWLSRDVMRALGEGWQRAQRRSAILTERNRNHHYRRADYRNAVEAFGQILRDSESEPPPAGRPAPIPDLRIGFDEIDLWEAHWLGGTAPAAKKPYGPSPYVRTGGGDGGTGDGGNGGDGDGDGGTGGGA